MFKRLAKFRLFQSRGTAPGLQGAMPANDNQPNGLRPRGPRRIRPQALVCHWSLIDDGTRLGCRWQPEAPAQAALRDSDSERTNNQTSNRKRPGLAWPSPPVTKFNPDGNRDAGGHRKCATLGSHWSFSAGEQNLALRDEPSLAAQDFT
jgi:hypothetical protein